MSLIKHQTNELIFKVSPDMLTDLLDEVVTIYHDCKKLYDSLKDFAENGGDEFDLMDEVEPYANFSVDNLRKFKTFRCSKSITVNKYLERVFDDLMLLDTSLKSAMGAAFCITERELQVLCKQCYKVVAGMIFFVLVEFDVFGMITEDGQVDATDVDEILSIYCQRARVTVESLVNELIADSQKFSLTFDVFDSYPELENKFLEIMGPNIVGVDESVLTIDMVMSVVDGKVSPEELITLIEQKVMALEEQNG